MPIHDVGYRTWKGTLTATWTRWLTITEIGIRTAFSSRWIRRIVLASWFPVIYFGIMFFMFERMMETSPQSLMEQISGMDTEMMRMDVPSPEPPTTPEDPNATEGLTTNEQQPLDELREHVAEVLDEAGNDATFEVQKRRCRQ